ncbi:MAG: hypothetical protein ACJA02_000128 [Myxococcota bacterium]|jgi:hypothetical protein
MKSFFLAKIKLPNLATGISHAHRIGANFRPFFTVTSSSKEPMVLDGRIVGERQYIGQINYLLEKPTKNLQITINDHKQSDDDLNYELEERFATLQLPENSPATKEDLIQISKKIILLLRDQDLVSKGLNKFESYVTKELAKDLTNQDRSDPDYLIPIQGCYMIGPPPSGWKENEELNDKFIETLFKYAQTFGVNKGNKDALFVGVVNNNQANQFIGEGNIFREDGRISGAMIHGELSHLFQFFIVASAIESGDIDLSLSGVNGGKNRVTIKKLLKALTLPIEGRGQSGKNMWTVVFDNIYDLMNPNNDEEIASENFDNSFRSPNNVQSMISCFGDEFGVPKTQSLVKNLFWTRCSQIMREAQTEHGDSLRDISKEDLYYLVMPMAMIGKGGPADVKGLMFGRSTDDVASIYKKSGYEIPAPGIHIRNIEALEKKGELNKPI